MPALFVFRMQRVQLAAKGAATIEVELESRQRSVGSEADLAEGWNRLRLHPESRRGIPHQTFRVPEARVRECKPRRAIGLLRGGDLEVARENSDLHRGVAQSRGHRAVKLPALERRWGQTSQPEKNGATGKAGVPPAIPGPKQGRLVSLQLSPGRSARETRAVAREKVWRTFWAIRRRRRGGSGGTRMDSLSPSLFCSEVVANG